jgi:hypothetical protein
MILGRARCGFIALAGTSQSRPAAGDALLTYGRRETASNAFAMRLGVIDGAIRGFAESIGLLEPGRVDRNSRQRSDGILREPRELFVTPSSTQDFCGHRAPLMRFCFPSA